MATIQGPVHYGGSERSEPHIEEEYDDGNASDADDDDEDDEDDGDDDDVAPKWLRTSVTRAQAELVAPTGGR